VSLIERLEAVAQRLEAALAGDGQRAGERMRFYEPVAVLLPDGRVKVHAWNKLQQVDWHTSDDWCEEMTQEEFREWSERIKGIALA